MIAGAAGPTPIFAQTRRRYGMGAAHWLLPGPAGASSSSPRRKTPFSATSTDLAGASSDPTSAPVSTHSSIPMLGLIAVGVTHLSTVRPMARRQLHIAGAASTRPGARRPRHSSSATNLRGSTTSAESRSRPRRQTLHHPPPWQRAPVKPVIQIDHVLGRGLRLVRDDVATSLYRTTRPSSLVIRATGSAGSKVLRRRIAMTRPGGWLGGRETGRCI